MENELIVNMSSHFRTWREAVMFEVGGLKVGGLVFDTSTTIIKYTDLFEFWRVATKDKRICLKKKRLGVQTQTASRGKRGGDWYTIM